MDRDRAEQPQQQEQRKRRRVRPSLPIRWLGQAIALVAVTPARAVRGTARRVADPARQVAAYWQSDRATIRQGFGAVTVSSIGSLVSGIVLAGMEARLDAIVGLFVLIPAAIGMRGNIFGALSARFGTSIHAGLFEVSRRRDSPFFQNVYAVTLLTVATSVVMGILARAIAALLGIATISAWDYIAISLVGGTLSSAVVLVMTLGLSVLSYRRGWDLDSVGGPIITMMGDLVTLPALLLASYLVDVGFVTPAVGALGVGLAALSIVRGWTTSLEVTRKIVRESFPVLCLAIVLDVLAGSVVEPRVEGVFLPYPAFLLILPSFLEDIGALGSIMAARLGSKLHLGAVSPTARPDATALLDGTVVLSIGVVQYSFLSLATLVLSELLGKAHPGVPTFIGVIMVGAMIATLVASIIGYYAGVVSYRFGFDPDNHTIPMVTSGMDLLGVICLVIALSLFGVA
jgi:mgtE-like transporter